MQIEEIVEPIELIADFRGGHAQPIQFDWAGRTHVVSGINGHWVDRSGAHYALCYSVQAGLETYYLRFASGDVQWYLDRIILDG